MIIKALTLENFKGIAEPVRIEFKPITLLFGPNSAGKSTVLQALVYTREILERHNLDPDRTLLGGEWMDLGGFRNLVNGHNYNKVLKIGFELDLSEMVVPDYLSESESYVLESWEFQAFPDPWLTNIQQAAFTISIKWSERLNRPIIQKVDFEVNYESFAEIESTMDARDVNLTLSSLAHPIFTPWLTGEDESSQERVWLTDELLMGAFKAEELPVDNVEPNYDADLSDIDLSNIDQLIEEARYTRSASKYGPIGLTGQKDALPASEKRLEIASSAWASTDERFGPVIDHPLASELLITSIFSGLIAGPIDLVRRELDKLIYIGPLREVPSRHPAYRRSPDVSRWARGTAAWDVLHNADSGFLEKVNDWLTGDDKLNSGYSVTQHRYRELAVDHPITLAIEQGLILDEDDLGELFQSLPVHTRVAIREAKTDLEVFPQDIGVGISQVIPILVGAIWQRSGILAVEQPELHIHPALQVSLGDLFASELENNDGIYLLETHSEHLMLRFLRRIRETAEDELPPGAPTLKPEQVAVIYVQSTEHGVELTPLPISEEGEFLERWPAGFFEERDDELF